MGREMGEEDAPPAVETEESPAPAEGAPAADDPPPSPPVEAEETPTPADDAPGPSEDSRVDAGVVARGPRTGSHHDAGAGAEDLVDCTFVVLPERFEHSATIPATEPFASVKSMLASTLPIPLDAVMTLRQPDGGEPLPDDACLADYGVGAADEVELELVVAYRTEREMRAEAEENARREAEDFARLEEEAAAAAAAEAAAAEEARLADTSGPSLPETLRVTVRGARKGEPSRVVTVRIDASGCRKPRYLGGFRDRRDGTVYHHASNQTIPTKPRAWKTKFTTETQTMVGRSRLGTDQSRGVHADGEEGSRHGRIAGRRGLDREVHDPRGGHGHQGAAHPDAAEVLPGYAGEAAGERAQGPSRRRRSPREEEEEEKSAEAEERRRRFEVERRIRPKTSEDFELLYGELEQWRVRETAKVEAEFPPETDARRLAMKRLLAKETELIRTIGRLRIAANNANRERRVELKLEDMSQTKRWERKDGSLVEVDTPFTVRARELARLYDALRMETRVDVSTDERLDVLVHVKWTVKEFDCGLTREIVELADREADLLNRGRDPAVMTGLRRRIANLFLQFVETPEFNPESARYSVTNVVNGMETDDDGLTLQEAAMLSATQKFSRPIRNR